MSKRITESFYVQLQAERMWYGDKAVHGFKAVRITRKKPERPVEDAVVVKLRLSLDAEAFEQVPVAEVDIPLAAVTRTTVTAAADA